MTKYRSLLLVFGLALSSCASAPQYTHENFVRDSMLFVAWRQANTLAEKLCATDRKNDTLRAVIFHYDQAEHLKEMLAMGDSEEAKIEGLDTQAHKLTTGELREVESCRLERLPFMSDIALMQERENALHDYYEATGEDEWHEEYTMFATQYYMLDVKRECERRGIPDNLWKENGAWKTHYGQ